MRLKGFWLSIGIILVFSAAMKGDAKMRPGSRHIEPVTVPAGISYEAGPVTMEAVEPLQTSHELSAAVTLMTFNIHSANNAEGSNQLEAIIEEIRETGAQIIGLQEVERMMPRSGYQDQARLIAEELGYHYYYGGNINILGAQYGNVLLSKYPITAAVNHRLPKERLEPRGVIEARIEVEGIPFSVYVTHLGLNPDERRKQIMYINELLTQSEDYMVLLGDFNNHPDSPEMDIINTRMTDSAAALEQSSLYTFSYQSTDPDVRLDRIYVSDNIHLEHHEVRPSAVSDHERVLTQIVLKVPSGEGIYKEAANIDN
jgi:endonuclease/exonuclease/phosphatase family metal-dependent hydrolase